MVLAALLIGLLSRPDRTAWGATSHAAGLAPVPAAGIRLESNGGPLDDGWRRFLYEAARSGKFGVVETTEQYQRGSATGLHWQMRHLRFDYVDDLDRCAMIPAGPAPMGLPRLDLRQQILQHGSFVEDLASGRCVIATEIDRPGARYVLQPDRTLIDSQTGAIVAKLDPAPALPKTVEPKLWKAFGLARVNATRFDDSGEKQRPDNVPDDVLVRTLTRGSDALKYAAVTIIFERLQISQRFLDHASMGGYGPKIFQVKANSPALGLALLQSGLFRSDSEVVRADALRAAAAIPSAREQLMPAVMEAMVDVVVPPPLDARERLLSGRIEGILPGASNGLFRDTTPRPGRKFSSLVDNAALAAARFGPDYAEMFVSRYETDIVSALRDLPLTQGIPLAVAAAKSGDKVVKDALAIVDTYGDGYVLRNVAALLAAHSGLPSPEVMAVVRSRCDTTERRPNRRFSALFCDAMEAKAGDQAALERLSRIVVENRSGKDDDMFRPADEAAYALLFDVGPAGVERLRSLAMTAEPAVANIALEALCHLGPDAGPEIIARALTLANAAADEVTRRRNAQCSAPERTTIGRFVDVH